MISSLAWVPAGVSDPRPKKYELSEAEQELVKLLEQQGSINNDDNKAVRKAEQVQSALKIQSRSKGESPAHNLPADLRMDEYSDEDDDGMEAQVGVGRLLLGDGEEAGSNSEEDDDEEQDDEEGNGEDPQDADAQNDKPTLPRRSSNYDDSSDDDSDDDLNDVPDTREYMALDVEGLEAMGLSQVGGRYSEMQLDELGEHDDDSEAEDVEISPTDAVIVVGKAEDVSSVNKDPTIGFKRFLIPFL